MRNKVIKEIINTHLNINNSGAFKGRYEKGQKYTGCDFIVANFPYQNRLFSLLEYSNMQLLNPNGYMTSIAPAFCLLDPMADIKKKFKVEKERVEELGRHLVKSYIVNREAAIFSFHLKNFDGDFYINHYSKARVQSQRFSCGPVVNGITTKLKDLFYSGKTLKAKIKEQDITIGRNTQAYGVALIDWFQYGRKMDYKICGDICHPVVNKDRIIKFDTFEECKNFKDAYNHPLMRAIYSLCNFNRHILFTKTPLIADDFKTPLDVAQCLKRLGFTDDEINFLDLLSKDDYKRTYIDYAIDFKDGKCVVNHIPEGAIVAPDTEVSTYHHCIIDDCEQHPCYPDNNQIGKIFIIPIRSHLVADIPYNLLSDFSEITADVNADILWQGGEKSRMPLSGIGDNILLKNNNILSDCDIVACEVGKYRNVTHYDILRHARWYTSQKCRDIWLKRGVCKPLFVHFVTNIRRGPPLLLDDSLIKDEGAIV